MRGTEGPGSQVWATMLQPEQGSEVWMRVTMRRSWNRRTYETSRSFSPHGWLSMSFLLEKEDKAFYNSPARKARATTMDSLALPM